MKEMLNMISPIKSIAAGLDLLGTFCVKRKGTKLNYRYEKRGLLRVLLI